MERFKKTIKIISLTIICMFFILPIANAYAIVSQSGTYEAEHTPSYPDGYDFSEDEDGIFTILEIVPAIEQGEIGYLVKGYEPVPLSNINWDNRGEFSYTGIDTSGIYYDYTTYGSAGEAVSSDWFNNMIFNGTITDNICVKTVEANSVTTEDIDSADLIYLSAGQHNSYTSYLYDKYVAHTGKYCDSNGNRIYADNVKYTDEGRDMSWETALYLYKIIHQKQIAFIYDSTILQLANDAKDAEYSDNNVYKIMFVTMLMDSDKFFSDYESKIDSDGVYYERGLNRGTGTAKWYTYTFAPTNKSTQQLYELGFYNAKSMPDYLCGRMWAFKGEDLMFPSRSEAEQYKSDIVVNDTKNNYYTITEFSEVDSPVTTYNIIRYILGVKIGERELKLPVNILEIQPTADYSGKSYSLAGYSGALVVAEYLGLDTTGIKSSNYKEYINVNSTSTNGFNGMLEDIVSEYDFIYIGTNTTIMRKNSSGSTLYNDTALNGKIYIHNGDLIRTGERLLGTYATDYVAYTGTNTWGLISSSQKDYFSDSLNEAFGNFSNQYYILKRLASDSNVGYARLSGNDISNQKLESLIEYVDRGLPVMTAENLYNYDSTGILDNESNLKKFMEYVKDTDGVFLVNEKNAKESGREGLKYALTHCSLKPEFILEAQPIKAAYDYNGCINTSLEAVGNKYILHFEYYIEDESNLNHTYEVDLYIDRDGDGRFSDETADKDAEYCYSSVREGLTIKANTHYSIDFELSDDFKGFLPWKIMISDPQEKSVTSQQTGYTVIKGANAETIRVLQIQPTNKTYQTFDLSNSTEFLKLFKILETNGQYKLDITTITAAEFDSWYEAIGGYNKDNPSTDLLNGKYHMVILGFGDAYGYTDIGIDGVNNIKSFIETQQSVLFAHDTVSFTSAANYYTSQNNQNLNLITTTFATNITNKLRDLVGMDRFGVTLDSTSDKLASKDTTTTAQTQGFTNYALLRFAASGYSNASTGITGINMYTNYISTKVDKVNQGQVTEYPYKIDDYASVARTHGQYTQLDMEDDNITVWYTLGDSGGLYGNARYDAGNNYYIYSKGNITYSGAGHASMTSSNNTMEQKLFVNTIVAALTNSNHPPVITILDAITDNDGNSILYTSDIDETFKFSFRVYDEDMGVRGEIQRTVVYFDDNDNGMYDDGDRLIQTYEGDNSLLNGDVVNIELSNEQYIGESQITKICIEALDNHNARGSASLKVLLKQLFYMN